MLDTIVFGSGGNRGIAFGGAIKSLEKRDMIAKVHTFVGCSVGALVAALCAIGMCSEDIVRIILDTQMSHSIPTNELEILNLYQRYALYTNKTRENLIRNIISKATDIHTEMTLKQLYVSRGKTLIVAACCLNTQTTDYLSYKTHPDMPIYIAVCISMTIPLVFEAYDIDDFKYIDGAIFGHSFPIAFPRTDENTCIGFRLRGAPAPIAIETIAEYVTAIFDGRSTVSAKLKHTIDLTSDISRMQNIVSSEQKMILMELAFDATEKYLDIHF